MAGIDSVTPLPPATAKTLTELLYTEFDKLPAGHPLTDGRVFALVQEAYSLGLLAGRREQDAQIAEVCRNCGCQEIGR